MSLDNSPPRMIGESGSFLEMQEHVSRVAPLDKPVLIVGERGTGKELVAARLHFLSRRWENAFLKINCAAMSDSLLEAQLFGHESGAFTGATARRKGYFERADGGTLFLDELANTAMAVQEKILRVIEYSEFERLGGNETIKVDIRLVAATNEDLPALARAGRFREDLLDRLAFDVITLPPLRARAEDILVLAEHFAVGMVKELGGEYFGGFTESVRRQLLNFSWPGNVRQLKNVIERAVYQNADKAISRLVFDPFDSPYRLGRCGPAAGHASAERAENPDSAEAADQSSSMASHEVKPSDSTGLAPAGTPRLAELKTLDFKQHLQDYEIEILRQAMEHCQFNQRKTADYLQLSYHQLRGYLRKYDLLS